MEAQQAEVLEVDVYVTLPAVRHGMEEHDGSVAAGEAPHDAKALAIALPRRVR